MYHSITFTVVDGLVPKGDKNTWADWFLVPSSRPVFNPPSPKTTYIDIPGSDGHLDMTEALTGDVTYDCRKGSLEFIVDNWHREWHELYSEIMDYLHGQTIRAVLEDDPAHYYEGRFTVNQWKSEPVNSKITIDYIVHPYKFDVWSSIEDWEWDPFDFESDVVREYKDLTVEAQLPLTIVGSRKPVIPEFTVETADGNGLSVEYDGAVYYLPDGTSKNTHIVIREGETELTFYGHGTVSIDYRGGGL